MFDGYGVNLMLVIDYKWGVWSGSVNLNVVVVIFNCVDVCRLSLVLIVNSSMVNISELSVFIEKGILEVIVSVL